MHFLFLYAQFTKPDFDLPPLEEIFEFSHQPHGNDRVDEIRPDSNDGKSRMQYPFIDRKRKSQASLPASPYVPTFVKEMLAKAFLKDPYSYLAK